MKGDEDRETYDWLLRRSTLLEEIGRIMTHLQRESTSSTRIVRFIREIAFEFCESKPDPDEFLKELREWRQNGAIVEVFNLTQK